MFRSALTLLRIDRMKSFSAGEFYPEAINEFHIANDIRSKYSFDEGLYSINGNVVFADVKAVRKFVDRVNEKRGKNEKLKYGEVNAIGLLDEIFHFVLREYEETANKGVFGRAVEYLNKNMGEEPVRKVVFEFIKLFPPTEVYKGRSSAFEYLDSYTESRSNLEITVEEIILLFFGNLNPSTKNVRELFDENYFGDKDLYKEFVESLDKFFQDETPFGPDDQDIFTLLRSPILASPDSLFDQLEFIRKKWGLIIKDKLLNKILSSEDLIKEDSKLFGAGGGGPAPAVVPDYKHLYSPGSDYDEPEKFTKDLHWMPQVVLMAKNVYVWLDQLSGKYKREIKTLDQIPDEELDQLVSYNFTGLWLIGLWERSPASKRIKHIMGNIDAVASAYSLYDYHIAADLGGDAAYDNLNDRAKARGLRLASDMVPNHTGIYSDWVLHHPEYFIQSDYPPFPNYSFTGENLSQDPSIEVRIEDGYYRHSDAAVVFQRIDKNNGIVKYLYHGNDGTNMPWNDTAQLNMLKPEVREAVIQKIFDVARRFSVIRFDAAMTLTKRHYSRLWFPQPGTGGDIPSRAEYSMTKEEFDSQFPVEFWREVVDRINNELPETLLLAEAFWLMEGYFVRSLGMHRVYNSAFMHMMMNEENEKYRDLITNTLEFEPEILKRYVNFMSNPDEETAIRQFGTDDKYFGVLTLMITLPGLPMFAHGQIEGYTEKYGMEYKRAYYNEDPKQWLVERHEREIFPVLRKRYLFAEVNNFWFYDCLNGYGDINENVFAFTNSYGNEKALVVYNNKYDSAEGYIKHSTHKLVNENGTKVPRSVTLSDALGINGGHDYFYIARNKSWNTEHLFKGSDIADNGFRIYLEGFKFNVYADFEEIVDTTGEYHKLYSEIGTGGVASVKESIILARLAPVHEAFESIFDEKEIEKLIDVLISDVDAESDLSADIKFVRNKFRNLLFSVKEHFHFEVDEKGIVNDYDLDLGAVRELNIILGSEFDIMKDKRDAALVNALVISPRSNYKENFLVLLVWITLLRLSKFFDDRMESGYERYVEELKLMSPFSNVLRRLGRGDIGVEREFFLLNTLLGYYDKLFSLESGPVHLLGITNIEEIQNFLPEHKSELIDQMMDDHNVRSFLLVNEYENVFYYSKERLEELVDWIFTVSVIVFMRMIKKEKDEKRSAGDQNGETDKNLVEYIRKMYLLSEHIKECSERSEYKFDKLKANLTKKL